MDNKSCAIQEVSFRRPNKQHITIDSKIDILLKNEFFVILIKIPSTMITDE